MSYIALLPTEELTEEKIKELGIYPSIIENLIDKNLTLAVSKPIKSTDVYSANKELKKEYGDNIYFAFYNTNEKPVKALDVSIVALYDNGSTYFEGFCQKSDKIWGEIKSDIWEKDESVPVTINVIINNKHLILSTILVMSGNSPWSLKDDLIKKINNDLFTNDPMRKIDLMTFLNCIREDGTLKDVHSYQVSIEGESLSRYVYLDEYKDEESLESYVSERTCKKIVKSSYLGAHVITDSFIQRLSVM